MAQAKHGDTVKVHYTGRLDDGNVFDTSADRDPLEFTIGSGQVIQGFDQLVTGLSVGESRTQKIAAEHAYGPHLKEMEVEVPRGEIPAHLDPKVGDQYQLQGNGQTFRVLVTSVSETNVTMDGNHPLAGKNLTFEVSLVEIVGA